MPSRCISCASNVETQCICTCTNQLLDEINNKKIKKNRKIAQCPVPPAVEWIFHCCLLRWQLPPTAMRRVIETGRVVEGWRGFSSKAFSYLSASPSPILLLLLLVPFLSFCVRLRSQQFSRRSADDVTGRLTLRLVQEVTIASERRTGEGRREGDAFMILNLGTRKVSEKRRLG